MSGGKFIQDFESAYDQVSKSAAVSPGVGQQIQLYSGELTNRSGSESDLALLVKLSNPGFIVGSYISPGPSVNVTAAIQGGTATNLYTASNNDGFLVQAPKIFSLIGVTVSQAQSASPVYSFQYYNGTSYVPLTDIIAVPDYTATGDTVLFFSPPRDWVAGTTVGVGGNTADFSILLQATTAGGQAVKATSIWVGRTIVHAPEIPHGGKLWYKRETNFPLTLDALESVLPFFGVASSSNFVSIKYFSVK